jgi:hypothetical protein
MENYLLDTEHTYDWRKIGVSGVDETPGDRTPDAMLSLAV